MLLTSDDRSNKVLLSSREDVQLKYARTFQFSTLDGTRRELLCIKPIPPCIALAYSIVLARCCLVFVSKQNLSSSFIVLKQRKPSHPHLQSPIQSRYQIPLKNAN